MVARILKFRLLFICLFLSPNVGFSQANSSQVKLVVSSSVFVSGDLVNLQVLTLNERGELVENGALVNLYLVSSEGKTEAIERFNTAEHDQGMAFFLPSDLATGNYKLVAHIPGSEFQTEALVHVYSPKIFTSAIVPKNADNMLALVQAKYPESPLKVEVGSNQSTPIVTVNPSENSGLLAFKIFDPSLEGFPVSGVVKSSTLGDSNPFEIQFTPISGVPNSRYSVYFVDQGMTEEYFLEDQAEMERKLVTHRGDSKIWVYQFGPMGNRLGEIQVNQSEWERVQFQKFDNTVPFSEDVRSILNHKRSRKFINQVYRSDIDQVENSFSGSLETADAVYQGNDYEGVATLREALSGIVNKVSVSRSQKEYSIRMTPASAGFKYEESPLILLNGVPFYNIGDLVEIPFHQIESISVYNSIRSQKQFGTLGRFGVLSVQLKEEYTNPVQDLYDGFPEFHGINPLVKSFEKADNDAPDLRPVLLWNSGVLLQPNQSIQRAWNYSDVKDSYVIWGDLINEKGQTVQWVQPLTNSN